jgi:4'-phosphopantetheinyl transferase
VVDGRAIAGLEYNVSHHGSLVAMASRLVAPKSDTDASVGGGVGVDVVQYAVRPRYVEPTLEEMKEWVNGFGEADVFTQEEMAVIHAAVARVNGEERKMKTMMSAMFANWALKEAYVKAVGTGLVTDLLAVDFKLEGLDMRMEQQNGTESRGVQRKGDVQLHLGRGKEKRQDHKWHLEIERLEMEDGVEGLSDEQKLYYVAVALERDQHLTEDIHGTWEWLDMGRDILPFMTS